MLIVTIILLPFFPFNEWVIEMPFSEGGENIHNEYEFEFEWEHADGVVVAFIPVVGIVIVIIIIHPTICNPSIELCLVLVSHKSFDGLMIKCFVLRSAAPQDLQLLLEFRHTRPYIAKIRSNNSPPFAIRCSPLQTKNIGFCDPVVSLVLFGCWLFYRPFYYSLRMFL